MIPVALSVRSEYSPLSAIPKIADCVSAVKNAGYSALCLADGPGMYGTIEFLSTAQSAGIIPLISLVITVVPDGASQGSLWQGIALDTEGYRQLIRLSTAALTRDSGFEVTGETPHIRVNEWEQADRVLWIIRPENFFSPSQSSSILTSLIQSSFVNKRLDNFFYGHDWRQRGAEEGLAFARAHHIKVCAAPLSEYLHDDQKEAWEVIRAISEKRVTSARNPHDDRRLLTVEEIANACQGTEWWENTMKIPQRVDLQIELNKWEFPRWEVAQGKNADEELRELAFKGAQLKTGELDEVKISRLNYELSIIQQKKYATYFLVVADIINWARSMRIATTTRGSAAGSFVSYAIGIVTINPLTYGLPFERFLNPFRPSLPDIDMDFADYRRHEVLDYVKQKYGVDHVAQIGTFGTMQARAVVRDVGRALGYEYGFCDSLAKSIPLGKQGFPMTLQRALEESSALREQYETNPDAERLINIAKRIEGNVRHCSVHAAGVVIAPRPLDGLVPLQRDPKDGQLITQFDMESVEAAGLVKMDFLGIRNLTVVEQCIALVKQRHGIDIDIENIPLDDKKTFEKLSAGETVGLFQLNGTGMTRYIRELKPTKVTDIMAMVALYRPGPIDVIPEYISRKNGNSPITFPHPSLEKDLEESYGLLVYQDDVLFTTIKVAGYNWEEADKFRKAMGKKIPEEMAKQKSKFYEGCAHHSNLTTKNIDALWKQIEPFAAYGFNKAHACSYGMFAYQTAYLKAQFPIEYMCAVLNSELGNQKACGEAVRECKRLQIPILPPHVAFSSVECSIETLENGMAGIRLGLGAIKNLGENVAHEIVQNRKEKQWEDLGDFLMRGGNHLTKKSLEALSMAGALSHPPLSWGSPQSLVHNCEHMLAWRKNVRDSVVHGQSGLFAATEKNTYTLPPSTKETSESSQVSLWELQTLGCFVTTHPLTGYLQDIPHMRKLLKDVSSYQPETSLILAVRVLDIRLIKTKNQESMAIIHVIDESEENEIVVFPKTYNDQIRVWQNALRTHSPVIVEVKAQEKSGEMRIVSQRVKLMSLDSPPAPSPSSVQKIILKISRTLSPSEIARMRSLLKAYPGNKVVQLEFTTLGRIIETDEAITMSHDLRQKLHREFGILVSS